MINIRQMTINDLTLFKKWLYTAHVAKWYNRPLNWIEEIEKQDNSFDWIHHYIVEYNNKPIGFCQYYACSDSDEDWQGYTQLGGSYSIDYMVGEIDFVGKGFGKLIIKELISKVAAHSDAKRIVVQPEQENKASCGVLISSGFDYDVEKDIYLLTLISTKNK